MSIQENVDAVRARIRAAAERAGRDPAEITLCAATKTQTSRTIEEAIAAGITVCGENRVQEMTAHLQDSAYEGAQLHFIGRLQTNKVRQVVGRVSLIQSVDSLHLMDAIEKQAAKIGCVQDILLEVNIGREESKGGFLPEELMPAVQRAEGLPHLRLRGLMAIPPVAERPGDSRRYFSDMRQLFIDTQKIVKDNGSCIIDCLSMGMSGDFEDAIAEGATMVRVGTALFGPRPPMRKQ